MVKRKSFLASNEAFRVRILVEAIKDDTQRIGRATRLETGTGWKPVEHFENALRVRFRSITLEQIYTSVLLGEQSASKTDADHPAGRCPVRILTLVLQR